VPRSENPKDFDLIVIGGGPVGMVDATAVAAFADDLPPPVGDTLCRRYARSPSRPSSYLAAGTICPFVGRNRRFGCFGITP